MLLAIDVGNTQTTLGLFKNNKTLHRKWRMATNHEDTTDEIHQKLFGYFSMVDEDLDEVHHVALASVVPILTQKWQELTQRVFNFEPFVIDASRNCGIELEVTFPSQVGADRIANSLAAKELYGSPSIVVDFGTATNIDVVSKDGTFCGGAIMPGFMLCAQTLFQRAAKLSSVELIAPNHALGKTTEEAIQSGIVLGAATQIEGLVARIKEELDIADAPVIATGGASATIARATSLFTHTNPDLTLLGIAYIYQNALDRHKLKNQKV